MTSAEFSLIVGDPIIFPLTSNNIELDDSRNPVIYSERNFFAFQSEAIAKLNNIWINFGSKFAGDTLQFRRLDLALGTDANGWEGSGVGDIWELRKSVTQGPIKFNKVGTYTFTLAQIMRENPLPEIISVGIRVEKVK